MSSRTGSLFAAEAYKDFNFRLSPRSDEQLPVGSSGGSSSSSSSSKLFNFPNATFISKPVESSSSSSPSPSPSPLRNFSFSDSSSFNPPQPQPKTQQEPLQPPQVPQAPRVSPAPRASPGPRAPQASQAPQAPQMPQAPQAPKQLTIPHPPASTLPGKTTLLANPGLNSESLINLVMQNLNLQGGESARPGQNLAVLGSHGSSSTSSFASSRVSSGVSQNAAASPASQTEEEEACSSASEAEFSTAKTADEIRKSHLRLLEHHADSEELNEIQTTPLFTEAVREYASAMAKNTPGSEKPFSQYGLLAGDLSGRGASQQSPPDGRIFWNIAAPSSFFICGSQGSGKSHTLSCLLENALAPCEANVLPRPLTGIVFHYDTFISDTGGSPCEAAWLSSNPRIKVRVLCPPTNIQTMTKMYSRFPGVTVEELRLNESDLNTKRMLDLMAVAISGSMPLYLHVVTRILRDLRIVQQRSGTGFNYSEFKRMLQREKLTEMQLTPLKQRLETLESFMVEDQAKEFAMFSQPRHGSAAEGAKKKKKPRVGGTDWTPRQGTLTIVDLSCPCVTAEMACSLFNICLSLLLEQPAAIGRVVALDEAHKYMNESSECQALTENLLATIRLQRHLGARVIISTQEPTISPKLLDLCSVTVVHRFTSPDWLHALRRHLAGVSNGARLLEKAERMQAGAAYEDEREVDGVEGLPLGTADPSMELFSRIVALRVGEALLFAPSAVVGVLKKPDGPAAPTYGAVKRLAHGVMKVRIRKRTTKDGGRSIMAG